MKTEPTLNNRVLLVDDHPGVLLGLADYLQAFPEFRVCGTAHNAAEAQAQVRRLQPDVAVVDLLLGADCGLELIRQLRQQGAVRALVAYSGQVDPNIATAARTAGADDYVPKAEIEQLVPTLRSVLQKPRRQATRRG